MLKPRPVCPTCRRIGCTDPTHRPKPFAEAETTRERRPDYNRDRGRRRRFVKDALRRSGHYEGTDEGEQVWTARCELCGNVLTLRLRDWQADHIDPLAMSGNESGALRLSCSRCQRRQGGLVGSRRARRTA